MDASMMQAGKEAPAYALSGGKARRKKAPARKSPSSPKKKPVGKIYIGPNGGKYHLRKGRKIYL